MSFETLYHRPPPLFRQGQSALSRFIVLSALALFLMVADARFRVVEQVRDVVATALYPAQWLALRPMRLPMSAVPRKPAMRQPSRGSSGTASRRAGDSVGVMV